MKNIYKSAAYHIDPSKGFDKETISKLDEWLNAWLSRGYIIDQMNEITKEGTCAGYLFIFRSQQM